MKTPPEHAAAPAPRRLSAELAHLRARTAERAVTLREVIQVLGERAYLLLVLLLTLPFLTPLPLPGLSTPFGLAITAVALRLLLGRRPWLPKKLQRKVVPAGFFTRLFAVAAWVLRLLERGLRARLTGLTDAPAARQVHAGVIFLAALALLLPLPIPFTNTFPAWTILLVAGGLLERDGAAVIAGYVVAAAGVVYFVFLGEAAGQLVEALRRWWVG